MAEIYTVQMLEGTRSLLGEGPFYMEESDTFAWVDITAGTLLLRGPDGQTRRIRTGQYLGAAVPTVKGRFAGAMTTGLYLFDHRGLAPVCRPPGLQNYQRFNDGKCDAAGRFWCGTMPLFDPAGGEEGALYCLEPGGGCRKVLEDVKVSNGIAWSPDGGTMYYADTPLHRVDAFDFDPERGLLSNRRTVLELEGQQPDGMTTDEAGQLWIAMWGGSKVCRYDPDTGELTGIVKVPARYVTSCCFGGAEHRTLYITTCGEEEPENPAAGCVFTTEPGMRGAKTHPFDDSGL